MAEIKTTGNSDIDQATAEIAVVLRDAGYGRRDQELYDEAMRLRDEIMAGTRELDSRPRYTQDIDGAIVPVTEASDDRNLREHTEAANSGSRDYLWRWLETGQDGM